MAILINKVKEAFDFFDNGETAKFVKKIADTADVRFNYHKTIVDNQIQEELSKRGLI